MADCVSLEDLISGYYENRFSQIDVVENLHFSRRHKRKMNEIFALYSNNRQEKIAPQNRRTIGITRRVLIAAIILILATFLMGSIRSLISNNFSLTEHGAEIHMQAINIENAPKRIEMFNMLEVVPEGYKRETIQSSENNISIKYCNENDGHKIMFSQFTKMSYDTVFVAEFEEFEEIKLDEYNALLLVNKEKAKYFIVWDGGDYVYLLSVTGLTCDELIELACQNQRIWDMKK